MNKKVIAARCSVSASELINLPVEKVLERAKRSLAYKLAEVMLEEDLLTITEEADFYRQAKIISAEVVILTAEEHRLLTRKVEAFDKARNELNNF